MTTRAELLAELRARVAVVEENEARETFRAFLRYVKVCDFTTNVITPFEMWPHLETVREIIEHERKFVWLKARQIGASWLLAAYALWLAEYKAPSNVLLFSSGEDESKKFMLKSKFIYSRLPEGLRVKLKGDNKGEMEFVNDSSIQALASTENAGRSQTASLVIFDEADFHPYLDANYAAVSPTVDAGARLFMVSTVDYQRSDTLFRRTFLQAEERKFKALFLPWDVRPGRTAEWYAETMAGADDKSRFEKEYPATVEAALAPPQALAAFDLEAMQAMQADVREPLKHPLSAGPVHIYQLPVPGKRYVAASDTSHGVGQDSSVTVIRDCVTGMIVADVYSNLVEAGDLAPISVKLLGEYGNPTWAIEDNDWGNTTIRVAESLRYPRLYSEDGKKPGWHTGPGDLSRTAMWGDLMSAVKYREVTIPSRAGLAEFFECIKNPEKKGRVEARKGAHDDYPTAVGIAIQIKAHATVYAGAKKHSGSRRPVFSIG